MNQNLPKLELPESLNYIGVFLTMGCNLKCSYCINIPDSNQQLSERAELFPVQKNSGLTPEQWITALNRIPNREDLPITVQGGEPTTVNGLNKILEDVDHYIDILTNMIDIRFFKNIQPKDRYKLQRKAPYPSIRVSWHQDEMNRVWKDKGFEELVKRCELLKDFGFNVSPTKSESDVGIYMVAHPSNNLPDENIWKDKVPFETKEFLGTHDGVLYGHYAYLHSTDLVSSGKHPTGLQCECRTSELLIDPAGFIHNCHYHLYEHWSNGGLVKEFNVLSTLNFEFKKFKHNLFADKVNAPIGHILDSEFTMDDLKVFRNCYDYGKCIGCDVKCKNNRMQSLDDFGIPHSSVEIRGIQWPEGFINV